MAISPFPLKRSLAAILLGCCLVPSPASAQPPTATQSPASGTVKPWTIATAREQLEIYPKDPFLQYVYWQLNQREGSSQMAEEWLRGTSMLPPANGERLQNVDLMSIFSGALAVQESLQLDTLTGGGNAPAGESTVPISRLTGPSVKSHPWKTMLGDRKPNIGLLPRSVPDDFLFVRFDSLAHLGRGLALMDQFSSYTVQQLTQDARTQAMPARLQRQLGLELNAETIAGLSPNIRDLAIVSSDLFFSEGSDITLLLELENADGFRKSLEANWQRIQSSDPTAKRSESEILGVPTIQLATPDRAVRLFAAFPKPNLYVHSNSHVALERVLATIRGRDARNQPVTSLGDTDEFRYIRTLMPEGAPEENGWIYMSDPFIRKMVGPKIKLMQKRRLTCYNHMRMLGHASLLHASENGALGTSVEQLKQSRCLPKQFGVQRMQCPDGGTYELSRDGRTPRCSHHGSPHAMIPCCESSLDRITAQEETEYRVFLDQYNQYWRTFFDPIAIRIQMEPTRYRVETIILPLIDNSLYTSMASSMGGTPKPLDRLPVLDRNILTLATQIDKEKFLRESGLAPYLTMADTQPSEESASPEMLASRWGNLQQVALANLNFESAYRTLPPQQKEDLSRGLSWRVQILPFLGQNELYQRFHLNEPWDSPHNIQLLAEMPSVYRTPIDALNEAGKTTVVMPRNAKTILGERSRRLADLTDGTSNTLLLIDADPERAVPWTKPEDLEVDLQNPRLGWKGEQYGCTAVAFVDSHVELLDTDTPDEIVLALLTINGEESIAFNRPQRTPPRQRSMVWDLEDMVSRVQLARFVSEGLGDQFSLNLCDSDPLIDFNATQFLGMLLRSNRGNAMTFMDTEGIFALFALSINSPVYVSADVQNAAIVDESLNRIDELLARIARTNQGGRNPFFSIEQDFYRFSGTNESPLRAYGFRFGPIQWRFYWGRIGSGLVLASKPFILEQLLEIERARSEGRMSDHEHDPGPAAHAMLRIRPEHWNEVLTQYRLSWSENQRRGCINNLGPLSSLSRTVQRLHGSELAGDDLASKVRELESELLDSQAYCPAGGEYHFHEGSHRVDCSVHGTGMKPKQPIAPDVSTPVGQLLNQLHDLHMELTFMEEGLKAVATIELKP
ncbi:MAG: DUF1559 domain-containing protein [Pirellula sp.]